VFNNSITTYDIFIKDVSYIQLTQYNDLPREKYSSQFVKWDINFVTASPTRNTILYLASSLAFSYLWAARILSGLVIEIQYSEPQYSEDSLLSFISYFTSVLLFSRKKQDWNSLPGPTRNQEWPAYAIYIMSHFVDEYCTAM
jgi:hypothetical protein